jgi:cysteine desulfurase
MIRWLETEELGDAGEKAAVAADPGRLHTEGRIARALVEEAREQVAGLVGAVPRTVVFTSGGTEAINSAVWGATRGRPGPILLADVEHSAVRDSSARLASVVRLGVDVHGRIDPDEVEERMGRCASEGTPAALVHCQAANHEVGTIQPVAEVAEACRRRAVLLHVDACAAAGHVPVDVEDLGADLVSLSAHKLGGPPGIGALVVRRGLRLDPLLVGGEQERARRGGLENVPAMLGFGAAAEALTRPGALETEGADARRRTERLLAAATAVEGVDAVGDSERRVPHIVCVTIGGVEAEPVLLALDQRGIAAHSGSSCSSESLAPSPVLEAMGVDAERSLRLSVGWSTTDDDVEAFAAAFGDVVEAMRKLGS